MQLFILLERVFIHENCDDDNEECFNHTNKLAEGCEFSDGKTVIRWLGGTRSTVVWESMDDFKKVSLWDGSNRIIRYLNW